MARKSTIKKSLPKASSIRWCSSAGKNLYRNIVTDETRYYSRKINFKQPSNVKGISWQIVYRWKGRYTPTEAKKAKAEWTNWTKWKTPRSGSFRNTSGVKVARAAGANVASKISECDYWRVGNRASVTSGTYNVFANWAGTNAKRMNIKYDALQFQFAIRSFKSSTCQHGEWVYQTLKVFRKATVVDEVLVKTGAGGLQIDFNYIDDRGGSKVSITSIVDSSGIDILKSDIKKAPDTDSGRQSSGSLDWYPYKRSGYVAGQIDIPGDKLTRKPIYKETLTVTANYVTKDNVNTKFAFKNNGYVYGEAAKDSLPKPRITVTKNNSTGLVTVKAYKTDEFDGTYAGVNLTDISAYGGYVVDGEEITINPYYTKTTDMTVGASNLPDLLGTWYFRPPLNAEVTYRVSVRNEYNQWNGVTFPLTVTGAGYLFNGITHSGIHAALTLNTTLQTKTSTECTVELPYGRDLPFAAYGTGRSVEMTLKGYSADSDKHINMYDAPKYLKQLAKKLGVYWMRNAKGETFKVAVKSVDVEYVTHEIDLYNITITMEEVS